MAKGSDMPVEYYNYRVEFQARGAGHIHGVLWIDMKDDKIVNNPKFADLEKTFKAIKRENRNFFNLTLHLQ